MTSARGILFALFLISSAGGVVAHSVQSDTRSAACNRIEDGIRNMGRGDTEEALKDFQGVIASCASPNTKAQAIALAGEIHLSSPQPDVAKVRELANALVVQFADTPSSPRGHVFSGRIELVEGRSKKNFDAALAAFERVRPDSFPGNDALPEALFYAGETQRVAHADEDALGKDGEVASKYPRSIWTARALLGSALCLVRKGQGVPAMENLQQVRSRFPGTPEARLAHDRLTLLYRLHLRAPAPAFAFAGRAFGNAKTRYRNGFGLLIGRTGQVYLGHRDGVTIFSETGAEASTTRIGPDDFEPSSMGFLRGEHVAVVREAAIYADGLEFLPTLPQREGQPKQLKITGFARTWKGEWLVADEKTKTIQRFTDPGRPELFAAIPAARLSINEIDDVAVLNPESRDVVLFNRDAQRMFAIARRGPHGEFAAPIDLAFDVLGHLYVLDEDRATVSIFDPGLNFRASFALPSKGPGSVRKPAALSVDSSGRLYILDADGQPGQQVLVYQ